MAMGSPFVNGGMAMPQQFGMPMSQGSMPQQSFGASPFAMQQPSPFGMQQSPFGAQSFGMPMQSQCMPPQQPQPGGDMMSMFMGMATMMMGMLTMLTGMLFMMLSGGAGQAPAGTAPGPGGMPAPGGTSTPGPGTTGGTGPGAAPAPGGSTQPGPGGGTGPGASTSAMQRLADTARRSGGAMNKPGWCLGGVQTTLRAFGGPTIPPLGSAYRAADYMAGHPDQFEEVKGINAGQLKSLGPGYIVVYERGGSGAMAEHGHIYITLGGGKEASSTTRDIFMPPNGFRVFKLRG